MTTTIIVILIWILFYGLIILFDWRNKVTYKNIGDAISLISIFNLSRKRWNFLNSYNYMLEDYNKYFWSFKTGIAIKPQFKRYIFEQLAETSPYKFKEMIEFGTEILKIRGE